MMNIYNPLSEGYHNQVSVLDKFIKRVLKDGNAQDLVRLNTYLRRYVTALGTKNK